LCCYCFALFFFFLIFVFPADVASSALPTIESLYAEKAKLEGEREKLDKRLEAGMSVAVRVAIHYQIAAIDNNIAEVRKQIIALISAPSKPSLSIDDVTKWLDANPLTVDQPTTPTSLLWWKLGEKSLNAKSATWAGHPGFNVLAGVTGAGKTRSMYEMLSRRFGFYWTCSRRGNGGSTFLDSMVGKLPLRLTDDHNHLVNGLVHEHLIAYSILLLQWRRRFPHGTPLQWHVFQTTTAVVDSALSSIFAFLNTHAIARHNVSALLDAAKKAIGGVPLLLMVDEAQELTRFGGFTSRVKPGEKLTLLSPFARACYDATALHGRWFAGTSFSLRNAVDLAGSAGGKDAIGLVVYCELAFGEVSRFREYLREVVGASISDALADELFVRFAGRARPVAVLAEYLVKSNVATITDADMFRERVLDVANVCERDLLASPAACGVTVSRTSLVAAFIEHMNRTGSHGFLDRFLYIAKAVLEQRTFVVTGDDAEVLADHGIGQVTVKDIVLGADLALTVRSLTVPGTKNADCCCTGIGPDWREGSASGRVGVAQNGCDTSAISARLFGRGSRGSDHSQIFR
jgi:hypothetical protein